ncbi:MAG: GNAT family N-acetyltransferase [Nocardioidaceae bacterium]
MTEPPWPDGLTLHHYSDAWSAATLAAHNAAFVDHWSFIPWTESRWQQWVDGTKNRRDDVSWVVVDDAEPDVVVGYLLSNEYEAATVATGRREAYLAKIGVRRQLRGRGIASSLLAHALREYAARGYQDSALDVDTANASGAFALYERLGYTVERRAATFEFLIPPRP